MQTYDTNFTKPTIIDTLSFIPNIPQESIGRFAFLNTQEETEIFKNQISKQGENLQP